MKHTLALSAMLGGLLLAGPVFAYDCNELPTWQADQAGPKPAATSTVTAIESPIAVSTP